MFDRKYLYESALWIAAFALSLFAAKWLARQFAPDSGLRLLALVPVVLAIGGGLWVELRQVGRMDELQRLTYQVATLCGAMLGILFCAIAFTGEALQLWARVAPIWVIASMGAGFLAGWIGARRHYG
jgi:fucose permease